MPISPLPGSHCACGVRSAAFVRTMGKKIQMNTSRFAPLEHTQSLCHTRRPWPCSSNDTAAVTKNCQKEAKGEGGGTDRDAANRPVAATAPRPPVKKQTRNGPSRTATMRADGKDAIADDMPLKWWQKERARLHMHCSSGGTKVLLKC